MKQKKHRLLCLVLALTLAVGLLAAAPQEADAERTDTDIAYAVTGGNIYFDKFTGTITGCDQSVTAAAIPAAIEGVPVTGIWVDAFRKCSSLTSVTIPDSVTYIEAWAFEDCISLTDLNLGSGVNRIGACVFYGCTGLTELTIPESVTSIDDCAFMACGGLTDFTIGSSVSSIGNDVFAGCSSLTNIKVDEKNSAYSSVDGALFNKAKTELVCCPGGKSGAYTVPDNVITIGQSAFLFCQTLTEVTIPNSVTDIKEDAFGFCTSLTSVTIPDSVTCINDGVFFGCNSLTSVTIPDSVTSIGRRAFDCCESLAEVTVPNGVTSIGDSAFSHCYSLAKVTIPSSVVSIECDAFKFCDQLADLEVDAGNSAYASVDGVLFNKAQTELLFFPAGKSGAYAIPDGVTSIGDGAFDSCFGLTNLTIPKGVTKIGECAFLWCIGLTDLTIPEGVTSIGGSAFYGCDSLTSITIPSSVTSIGYVAFLVCDSLRDVYYDGSEAEWAAIDMDGEIWPDEHPTIHFNSKPGRFHDVAGDAYYGDAVAWAVANNVTQGLTATTFGPNEACTRAQIVTFLWRAAGCPEPTGSSNPFADVKASDYYYKAVLWAVEKGVTQGMSDTAFGPGQGCTRGQVVTFLWRYENQPAGSASNPFGDVASGDYYYSAVLWAVKQGVTQGLSTTSFGPDATCTRAQIVTFLYRDLGNK